MTYNRIISEVSFSKAVDIKRLGFIIKAIESYTKGDRKVLDVGCGNGLITMELGKIGYQVKGVDISNKTIDKAIANNNLTNVTFEVADVEVLSIQDVKYDVIICSEVLEHLKEPGKMLIILKRLLKENGILIVTVPNGKGPRELFITKPMQWLKTNTPQIWVIVDKVKHHLGYDGKTEQSDADDLTHIHFFTKKKLNKLSSDKGYSILKFGKANFLGDVFPFSFIMKKSLKLQYFDCNLADILPHYFTCGFNTVWKKNNAC
ncbi:class I SAM-dependent methyltransferase [Chondrinema litorale]|uniref:class I SAM-dependent methyltransferase n=1 Tax=Chondrinema litorale TaxID=2994555 RepID=UPI0025426D02|nr:class I SAM-dependent methyltransferase [Chondrinema litorale]UZS00107.1 class I SAM-dependent methyltransferase [Chondrinema litorale]